MSDPTVKDEILKHVAAASQSLGQASMIAMKANPLSASVPILKELTTIGLRLNNMMQDINKLQGL